ncbi:IclR family transcriptional regulator [Mesorhizobium sp. CAU 1741]|uniref:IclR family transcriptional regulator n=1 Tax=Mesorhizobium sp. CAU 1741 TaxID=3140366 RepID=UPI00325BE59D
MIVRQVQNAIRILEYFVDRKSPATLSEIADEFGWPRSSTFNLIETLCKNGLLHEPRFRGGYYPTHRLLTLGTQIVSHGPLSEAIHAMVASLARATDETAVLSGLSGNHGVFLDVVESSQPIRYFAHVGQPIPLYATAAGRALLSLLSARDRATILSRTDYVRYAPNTAMSAEEVERFIAEGTAKGYFMNDNGYAPDLLGIAIPLPIKTQHLCLMVAGPSFRMQPRVEELLASVRDAIDRYLADDNTES